TATLSPTEITDFIFHEIGHCYRVYAILYTVGEILRKRDYGSHFLEHIITESKWVYYENEKDLDHGCAISYYSKYVERIQKKWNRKLNQATHFIYLLDIIELKYEEPRINLMIVKLALEQICIGLAQVFWEFKPKEFSL